MGGEERQQIHRHDRRSAGYRRQSVHQLREERSPRSQEDPDGTGWGSICIQRLRRCHQLRKHHDHRGRLRVRNFRRQRRYRLQRKLLHQRWCRVCRRQIFPRTRNRRQYRRRIQTLCAGRDPFRSRRSGIRRKPEPELLQLLFLEQELLVRPYCRIQHLCFQDSIQRRNTSRGIRGIHPDSQIRCKRIGGNQHL